MSHARSAIWDRKPLPMWTESQEKAIQEGFAMERLQDWMYELADNAEAWREFAP